MPHDFPLGRTALSSTTVSGILSSKEGSETMTKLRVLALHGFGQNAHMFKTQIGSICRTCADDIEFVFPDGPIVVHPPDEACSSVSLTDENGMPLYREASIVIDPCSTLRGWFIYNETRTKYQGVEESLRFLRSILKAQQFDGIFGFSQGAVMASYLCAYLENPSTHPLFSPRFHPPMKFAILASSLAPADPPLPDIIRTPTLHALGRNDTFMTNKESATLVRACRDPRVEYHDGGHFVQTKATWRRFYREWMLAFRPGSTVQPDGVAGPVPKVVHEHPPVRSGAGRLPAAAGESAWVVNPECGLCTAKEPLMMSRM
ncbi:hypothetical protein CALVIDRAFT_539502 [Calocera viscosa TUFC12733]|uniref:Serine hydrolase domain-containing protein n=1 Tax=Calocera viscosa (strain TUFC12733) TaxID=1330018 RepID=A0A167JS54_CALVF|nr:hypothetical protein CALVIDRAFT_539502 [Calocera viscosa TUFC12733]